MPRLASRMDHEAARASLSMAGLRQISQASVAPGAGVAVDYTVVSTACRRVVCIHLGIGTGDIRFNYRLQGGGSAAAATDIPLLPERYFVVDAEKGDKLSFFNTTGGAVTVYLMEIE